MIFTQTFVLILLEIYYVVSHFAFDLQVLNIINSSLMHRTPKQLTVKPSAGRTHRHLVTM
jgi:hypothetical protein